MEKQKVKEELIRRYKYLYENKELILSLCISSGIEEKSLKNYLRDTKKALASYKKTKLNDPLTLTLMMKSIEQTKVSLRTPEFYLKDQIPEEFLVLMEDFLFSDSFLEETALYKEIEFIKSDKVEMANAEYLIEAINEKRRHSVFLRNRPIFTVWHILDYVRINHPHNQDIKEFLDIFYNIERTISTGLNWESGYYLEHFDEEEHQSYIEAYPYYITSGTKTPYDESYILVSYKGNEFEHEDEYFTPITEDKNHQIVNDYPTDFVYYALRIDPFTPEEKNKIYVELQGETKKITHEEK